MLCNILISIKRFCTILYTQYLCFKLSFQDYYSNKLNKNLFKKIKSNQKLNRIIILIWKRLNAGAVPENKEYGTGTLSNVRRCWLAMPLVAGVLRWVLVCRTIEIENESLVYQVYWKINSYFPALYWKIKPTHFNTVK